MEFVEWTEKYTVGNPLVDAYHHIFFQMVDEFRTALAQEVPPDMEDRINFLVDYTIMHFESEEKLMEKAGYPDSDSHRESHRLFRLFRTIEQIVHPSKAHCQDLTSGR